MVAYAEWCAKEPASRKEEAMKSCRHNRHVWCGCVVSALLLSAGCASSYIEDETMWCEQFGTKWSTSVLRLISNPEKYNGKAVQVTGWGTIDSAGRCAISLEHPAHVSVGSKAAVWLDLNAEQRASQEELRGTRCIVEGIFEMTEFGPDNAYSGCIAKIIRLDPLLGGKYVIVSPGVNTSPQADK